MSSKYHVRQPLQARDHQEQEANYQQYPSTLTWKGDGRSCFYELCSDDCSKLAATHFIYIHTSET